MEMLTLEDALYVLGTLNGDLSPCAKGIREKLLKYLVQDPSVFND